MRLRRVIDRPYVWGLLAALGILTALVLALALANLSVLMFSIFMAAFITVGLDPLVRWLERKGMTRAFAILTVISLIIVIIVGIIWIVVPVVVEQLAQLIDSIPDAVARLRDEPWFDGADSATNGVINAVVSTVSAAVQDPAFWAALGGGVTQLAFGAVAAVSGAFFIMILTIYFVGTYDATKDAAYRLVSRSHRASFIQYAEQILQNVGRYLSGMVVLAFMNATFSTLLLLAVGIPSALLIGIVAFFITIIPLIGTVLTTIAMSIIAFIYSPPAGLIVLVLMLIYMQLEAYVLTPRIMSKAVKVPGSVVLISAIAGGTLFGLPGSLVAIPASAGIILVVKGVVMPLKERS
jgi:predicted PurR-regulated permease PerM